MIQGKISCGFIRYCFFLLFFFHVFCKKNLTTKKKRRYLSFQIFRHYFQMLMCTTGYTLKTKNVKNYK